MVKRFVREWVSKLKVGLKRRPKQKKEKPKKKKLNLDRFVEKNPPKNYTYHSDFGEKFR